MTQLQNVQRGQVFFFFLYSVVAFAFVTIKLIKNKIETPQESVQAQKYKSKQAKTQSKAQKAEQNTVSELGKQKPVAVQPPVQDSSFNDTLVGKIAAKVHNHIYFHLPIIFPFAMNLLTGSSYGFLFFWFFVVFACFIVINQLKMHQNCVQNRIVRIILEHLGYIFSAVFWLTCWATSSASGPYFIVKQ